MSILFWDASALAKRYVVEIGTEVVNSLFLDVSKPRMVGTVLGYAETHSVLLRHLNRGAITYSSFVTSKTSLRVEVVISADFELLTIDNETIYAGIAHCERYNVNANDGAILAAYLRYIRMLPLPVSRCVLIASDQRLLVAAQAEGLITLDPERISAVDVPSLLAGL